MAFIYDNNGVATYVPFAAASQQLSEQATTDSLDAEKWRNYKESIASVPDVIDTTKYGSAADLAAAVSQGQYNEWKNTFLPAARRLNAQTTYENPELVNQGITQAVGNVNRAFNTTAGVQKRYAQHYGVAIDPAVSAVNDRVNQVQRSASVVDAANRIRQNLADRNKQIMQTGTTQFKANI